MEEAKTGADELQDDGAEGAGYALREAKQRLTAASGGGKIKFRGVWMAGGRARPCGRDTETAAKRGAEG